MHTQCWFFILRDAYRYSEHPDISVSSANSPLFRSYGTQYCRSTHRHYVPILESGLCFQHAGFSHCSKVNVLLQQRTVLQATVGHHKP
jgi:hypothetical protein